LRDREQEIYQALLESQRHLASELAEAAGYVRSLLPKPLSGPVTTQWCFQPSSQLGGDAFGYHRVDDRRFAIYLLDVCGHGVGAALLSVAAINVLRSQTLPGTDFSDPGAVLSTLNKTFRMEEHNNMYFTIWYGVFDEARRVLTYASGGHPPAILFTGNNAGSAEAVPLRTPSPAIGCLDEADYSSASFTLGSFARLFVLSDGVYEISKPDGTYWSMEGFTDRLSDTLGSAVTPADHLRFIQELRGSEALEDDFSLLEVLFQ
jgi:sigma-B regulation protein RsbU (phosphoserine phosphatase)